jgi:hypothetical protein
MSDKFGLPKKKGIDPINVRINQDIRVSKKADKTSTSLFLFLNVKDIFNPVNRQTIEITKKKQPSQTPLNSNQGFQE